MYKRQDVTDATATFTGVRRDAAYTFTLTADGLDAPITLEPVSYTHLAVRAALFSKIIRRQDAAPGITSVPGAAS